MTSSDSNQLQRPEVSRYRDYRIFLRDFYEYKKAIHSGFSYRRFSQMVGLSSPNYLQLVMNNKRNLSDEMAARVAATLKLPDTEARYFTALVAVDNCKTDDSRVSAQRELLQAVKGLITKEIPQAQSHILSEWYHLLVRELVLLADFQPSGEWIAERLNGLVSPAEAEQSIAMLLKTGFLRVESGVYLQADPVLDTGNQYDEVLGLEFHKTTLLAWSKALSLSEKQFREFGVINIPISSQKIPELKARLRQFQDELIGWLQAENSPDRIVQLGLYLIPTSR